jgi:prepilin peptidase CpaA
MLLAVLAAAVLMDIRRGKIYNALTVPAMAAGLAIAAAGGVRSLQASALGLVGGLALGGILMTAAHLGGGDAKLLMAIGALKGLNFLIWSFLLGAVAGGVLAVAVLVRRRLFMRALPTAVQGAVQAGILHLGAPEFAFTGVRMPYAPALAVGCLVALVL